MRTLKANDFIEFSLSKANKDLAHHREGKVLALRAPMRWGLDDFVRNVVEDLCEKDELPAPRLIVVLETTGGFVEVVERLYSVFRKHFREVEFVIPNYAYSAGTVLALSGDRIWMDYYSVLGPIDPQLENDDGHLVPGMGYLHEFEELVGKINGAGPSPTRAELAYLLKRFDPARLFHIKQARDHSKSLLVEWLSKHKFKNWSVTQSTQQPVDDAFRRRRASEVAEILGDPRRWHSHGRGIGIRELTSEEIKLVIDDFGSNPELNKLIRNYYDLFIDYCHKTGAESAVHTEIGLKRI